MKAKIGTQYEIESDPHCFTLYKIGVKGEKSKNPGEEKRHIVGYYADIESLIKAFPNRALLLSEAENMKDAIAEVKALAGELREMIGVDAIEWT